MDDNRNAPRLLAPSERKDLLGAIRDAVNAPEAPYVARMAAQLEKWRLIHKFVHAVPFVTREGQKRSRQWRDVIDYARDLHEPEVLDWVLLQVDVAENLENGVRDMRPRRSGPCHPLLLEFVANKKRKAHVVYKWALAAEADGGPTSSTQASLTDRLLDLHSTDGVRGNENL